MPRPPRQPPGATADDAEAEFYEALAAGDIERLMALWADDDEVVCVHPGGPRVVGPAAIRASFASIFAAGPIPVRAERVRRLAGHTTAVHSVLERVQVEGKGETRTAWVVATNVYLKTAEGWRIAVHHASPGMPGDAQEVAPSPSVLH